jgi:hypothetical protein
MAGKNAGEYAYLLGLVIAVLAGIAVAANAIGSVAGWVSLLLVVLGVVVGLMNISEKESNAFLIASIALVVVGGARVFTALDTVNTTLAVLLNTIVLNVAIFAAPAAIITAVKAVHVMASKK